MEGIVFIMVSSWYRVNELRARMKERTGHK